VSPARVVARVPFAAAGAARVTIPLDALPEGRPLLQAAVVGERLRPLAVSHCMVVERRGAEVGISLHVLDVTASRVGARLLLVLASFLLAGILARRLRVLAPFAGVWPAVLLFLIAGCLLLGRVTAPAPSLEPPPPPLFPAPIPAALQELDPIDRITEPGFHALVEAARDRVPEGAAIAIVPASGSGLDERHAWQASWLLWPRRAEIVPAGEDAPRDAVATLLLGTTAASDTRPAAFRNAAGVLRLPEAAERK
jgi:hypothetical protein